MTSNNNPRSNLLRNNDEDEDDDDDDQEQSDGDIDADASSSSIEGSDCNNSSSLSSNAKSSHSRNRGESLRSQPRVDATLSGEQKYISRSRKRSREPETLHAARIAPMETISAPNLFSHLGVGTDPSRSATEPDGKRRSASADVQDRGSTLSDLTGLVLQQQQLLLQCLQGSQRSRDGTSTQPTTNAPATTPISTSVAATEFTNIPRNNPALQLQPQQLQLLSLLLAGHQQQQRQQEQPHHPANVSNNAPVDLNAQHLLSLLLNPTPPVAAAPRPPAPASSTNDLSSLLIQLAGGGQRPTVVASPSPNAAIPSQMAPVALTTSLIASLQQSLAANNTNFGAQPAAAARPLDPLSVAQSNLSNANIQQQQIGALLGQLAQAASASSGATVQRPQLPTAQPSLVQGSNSFLLDFIRSTLQNANPSLAAVGQPMDQHRNVVPTPAPQPAVPTSSSAAHDAASQLLLQMYAQGLLLQSPPLQFSTAATTKETKVTIEVKPMAFQQPSIKKLPMASATDKVQISPYQQLIRQQLEYFVSDQEDVDYGVQGRKKRVQVGQVGIRCQHCADLPLRQRGRGAVYYPTKLTGVYQAAQNMAVNHLNDFCHRLSSDIRNRLLELRNSKETASGGSKKYWAEACVSVGLYEDEDGLRFHHEPHPS